MNCKFTNVFMFAVGAAIGSAVTWKIVKDRYERIVQEELESIRETFDVCEAESDDDCDAEEDDVRQINWEELEDLDAEELEEPNNDLSDYAKLVKNYTSEKGGADKVKKKPYVISPDEFGELDNYRRFSLTYYLDGIIEDEDHDIVEDADEIIGVDPADHFGEYEEDSVFVRNEYLRSDFEILRDPRTYEEAKKFSPVQVDDE